MKNWIEDNYWIILVLIAAFLLMYLGGPTPEPCDEGEIWLGYPIGCN